jgi:dGTPase
MPRAKAQDLAAKGEKLPLGRLLGAKFSPPQARAAYATKWEASRGRLFLEQESATRTCYQRDRDRIIHSAAFRRLKHKTQVFIRDEGDYYRTRLTHSLEVAQIARSLARVLALDEDLAETLALAHDLGHTPFGHAGEDALSEASASIGGFDHNAHALRLVSKLEHRYAAFDGLNLTWETLEGLVKHNGPLKPPLSGPIASFDARWPLEISSWPGLEAQLASLADDIAYVNHDIDDGLRAHLFVPHDLTDVPLAGPRAASLIEAHGTGLELGRFIGELVRTLIGALVEDLLSETRRKLDSAKPASVATVRTCGFPLAAFSAGMQECLTSLKAFLFARMYRHPRVLSSVERAKTVVSALFTALSGDPSLLPDDWAQACGRANDAATQGVVRDYIAGMTDRFALSEYRRIFHEEVAP